MASNSCDDFYAAAALPEQFDEKRKAIESFIKFHEASQDRIVLVTSGGTTVPLESRTVRFIDNFSSGTRGSSSAEYFLAQGYLVVFLHRQRSLTPFHRHLQHSALDHLVITGHDADRSITVKSEEREKLLTVLERYHDAKSRRRLLSVSFTSLGDYLHLLRAACGLLAPLGSRVMLYLAAAVSDFYIPSDQMPEHKIQSSMEEPLQLSLQLVPKMLKPLVRDWLIDAFIVSFKLETDKTILIGKAHKSLEQYSHKVVVANVLDTRKTEVVLVTRDREQSIELTKEDMAAGREIEEPLVSALIAMHDTFCRGGN